MATAPGVIAFRKSIGARIRELREHRNETQENVASVLGLSQVGYRGKEAGRSTFNSVELFVLADHFDTTVTDLYPSERISVALD
ncbi:MAG: helix-turn-helix domain-containing protein [Promicromonosporaceae bacterium]|nr:helix-turn-helix domain-containing protein [Promicromonosporaceae bacterium]